MFYQIWGFIREVCFADAEIPLTDVLVQHLLFEPIIITAGHYKPPFSLDYKISANDIRFMNCTRAESGVDLVKNRLEIRARHLRPDRRVNPTGELYG